MSPRSRLCVFVCLLAAVAVRAADTPPASLLVLDKSDNTLVIVDPANLQTVARVPAGEDPHEIVVSDDGRLAYISNYGAYGRPSPLRTISVVDLVAQKALPPIDLGALVSDLETADAYLLYEVVSGPDHGDLTGSGDNTLTVSHDTTPAREPHIPSGPRQPARFDRKGGQWLGAKA